MRDANAQIELGRPAFDVIAALAHLDCGLRIVPEKMMMVQSRLRHRLRALNLADFDAYSQLLESKDGHRERRMMISALTTNVSHFFREPHHFEVLSKGLIPLVRNRMETGERIRIWSAGCSNGQEPYSIAMHLLRLEPRLALADFKILATDINDKVLNFARAGLYGSRMLSGVSASDRALFFKETSSALEVVDTLRKCVVFRQLNLLSDWPMQHSFDAIFCRNVVIYFDLETQEKLWPRFNGALSQAGLFFLGHSERIAAPQDFGFQSRGQTTYEKSKAPVEHNSNGTGGRDGTA